MSFPDDGMFLWVNDLARHTPWLHAPAYDIAKYGVVVFGVLLVVGWWMARTRGPVVMARALWAPLGTLLAVAVNQPLVHGFHEARPYTTMHGILVLADRSTDPSFPSDHATMAGAVVAGLFLVDRRLGVVASVAAFLLAFSRVYIAAHYPHDVLAGLALGAMVSLVGYLLVGRLLVAAVRALSDTPVAPLVRGDRTRAASVG